MEEKIHLELDYLKLESQLFSISSSSIELTSHMETLLHVCCVSVLELESEIFKFCHQI